MAGLRPVRRGLGAPVWPGRDAAYSLFGFGRGGHLCAGAVRRHLVAQSAGHRMEPGRRVEARTQAGGIRPLQVCAPSHLHRASADGPRNGCCLGLAGCVRGAGVVRGRVLDKTEPGGTPPSARLARRISRLQGACQGADSLCVLTREAGSLGNVASAQKAFYPPIVWIVGNSEVIYRNPRGRRPLRTQPTCRRRRPSARFLYRLRTRRLQCTSQRSESEFWFRKATELVRTSDRAEEGAVMRPAKVISCILSIVGVCALAPRIPAQTRASRQRMVIAASVVVDGKGHILHDVRIVIEGSKIVAIGPKVEGPVDYDLRGLTVLPGWIDAHVHITWIFGKDGKNAGTEGTTQEDAYQAASNAWVTLMAGFTTVQSVGAPNDIPLRDAIAKGILPGPRILTANEPLEGRGEAPGTPDEIRAYVRKQKQTGADLIKIFASKSIRQGGGMTLSQEQLNAACDEAKKAGTAHARARLQRGGPRRDS